MTGIESIYFHVGRISDYLGLGNPSVYLQELIDNKELISSIENQVKDVPEFETKKFGSVFDFRLYRIALYLITRAAKPAHFVETGVLHGLSSLFVLEAMRLNKCGRLTSIDLPSYTSDGPANKDGYFAVLPPGKEPGWTIQPMYRERWDLRLGASLRILPDVLSKHEQIDIFCHDSEHTYQTMWEELNMAWPKLKSGGILICDNIEANSSFFDFSRKVERFPLVLPAPDTKNHEGIRFAVLRK